MQQNLYGVLYGLNSDYERDLVIRLSSRTIEYVSLQ